MKKRLLLPIICIQVLTATAQKIDFDMSGRQLEQVNEEGYSSWVVEKTTSVTKEFADATGIPVSIEINCGTEAGYCIKSNWWKDGVQKYSKLVGDCVAVYGLDDDNNTPMLTDKETQLNFIITGLAAGEHSMMAYMNITDGGITTIAPIDVSVDGQVVLNNVMMSSRAQSPSASGQAYLKFNAEEGKPVTISFVSKPGGKTFNTSGIFINAIVFDRPNPKTTAMDPYPENHDMHANADGGSITLKWTKAEIASKHHIYIGTSEDNLQKIAKTNGTEYTVEDMKTANTYFWRIDEEAADGTIYEGDTWTFRPRRLAFPGAEGYGRYAIGGRGGVVYHVTNLTDDVDNPQPGSFRYGIKNVNGPRTIVFDVSGYITLKGRLTCSDPYVTIAGQTAPGKGIIFRGAPFGMASDGITRFIRMRLGYHNGETDKGLDGLGMAGNNHSIMDHCSISWTIDEAFSSRNAKNVTLQRTLISEALNIADHPNYGSGTKHGYAATIGGATGSYHHNLLAHNEGRNWSLSGGLDGGGAYAGHHDVFNNVVYNWGGRATDGGTHECNFVGNYYKMGASTSQKVLLNAQLEGTGKGSQSYYVNGNIRENKNGSLTQDKQGDTYKYSTSGGQVVDWTVFVENPFFESYANVETARAAYKSVLSDVGCNQPVFDDHDIRMVNETLTGTTSTKGSKSGKDGLIDRESDAGGYEEYAEECRPADYDTDADGMPDWWENIKGLNPNTQDNNTEVGNEGYTALEEYLNWIAEPHYSILVAAETCIDLKSLFAGFDNNPQFEATSCEDCDIVIEGNNMLIKPSGDTRLATIQVTASDNDNVSTMTRNVNLHITSDVSKISNPININSTNTNYNIFNTNGTLVRNGNDMSGLPSGVYILKIKDSKGTHAFKIVKE